MRALFATTVIFAAAGIGLPAIADTTTSTSGAGATVSIVSGSNGGTTIVIDSEKPCRTETRSTAAKSTRGNHTSVNTGVGGLSGSSSAGPNGVSVNIGPGQGSASTTTSTSSGTSTTTNQAAAGECVIVVHGPGKSK